MRMRMRMVEMPRRRVFHLIFRPGRLTNSEDSDRAPGTQVYTHGEGLPRLLVKASGLVVDELDERWMRMHLHDSTYASTSSQAPKRSGLRSDVLMR